MNSPRVNLLQKNELRYQGAVSRRFITASLVITPIVLVAVLSGIKLVQYTGVKTQLEASRAIWENLEPQLQLYKDEKQGLTANRKIMDLFEGWKAAQGSFVELLEEVQERVPENIQFTRLAIQGTQAASSYEKTEDVGISYKMVIEGISQGEEAENLVLDFQKDLQQGERILTTFPSFRLAYMRTADQGGSGGSRQFQLEGENPQGGEK